MRIITSCQRQLAVYWAPLAGADAHGRKRFASPVEMRCRWTDTQKEYLDVDGNKRMSMARVIVFTDVAPLGVLWLSSQRYGAEAGAALAEIDQTDTLNPFLNTNAYEIRKFSKIPTLKATQFLRVAML